ncbi:unnamed protein product [Linum tenue]|uniref:Uncharacterized protein n=1 Tax=Linum tenue TaxID=586396 RepID=A0AAV0NV10_9ROSI|nr:unnamed protein product [Linum tenue]
MKRRTVLPVEEEGEDRPPLLLIKGATMTIRLTVNQARDGFALLLKSANLKNSDPSRVLITICYDDN